MTQQFLALHIEGVGRDPSNSKGILFVSDGADEYSDLFLSDYEFDDEVSSIPDHTLLHRADMPIEGATASNQPFSERSSGMAVDLSLRGYDAIAERFLHVEKTATEELTESIDEFEQGIPIDDGGALANSVVYVGSEAILLGSFSGGSYNMSTRGFYDSIAAPHGDGANVYVDIPGWEDRVVQLYSVDPGPDGTVDASDLVRRYYGRIASGPEQSLSTSERGTRIVVPTRGALTSRDIWRANNNPNRISSDATTPDSQYHALQQHRRKKNRHIIRGDIYAETSIRRTVDWDNAGKPFFFRYEDGVYFANSAGSNAGGPSHLGSLGQQFRSLGGEPPDELEEGVSSRTVDADIHELFVVDRVGFGRNFAGRSVTDDLGTSVTDQDSETHADAFPYHPVAIDLAVAISRGVVTRSFNIFQYGPWGLGLDWLFEPNIGVRASEIINETPQYQVDLLVLGWEPEPIEWLRWSERHLLNPFGIQRAKTDDGKLTYQRVELADIETYSNALDNQVRALRAPDGSAGMLQLSTGRGQTKDVVQVSYQDAPFQDGKSQLIRADEDDEDRKVAADPKASGQLDYGVIQVESEATTRGVSRLLAQHFAAPQLTIRCPDYQEDALTYDMGAWVTLQDLPITDKFLIDETGTRIKTIDDQSRFVGQIIARTWRPVDNTYELTIMMHNFAHGLVRWRAPAGEILEVDAGNNDLWLHKASLSTFAAVGADAEAFNTGDEITVWDQVGTLHESTHNEIQTITQGTSPGGVSDAWKLSLDGWFSTDPSAGQIVRLARLNNYDNSTILANVDRVYAYLADNVGDPDLSGGDAEFDPYG